MSDDGLFLNYYQRNVISILKYSYLEQFTIDIVL